jgi:hypothetical protein
MQMFYHGNCRKLFMDLLPAPGSLLVPRSEMDKLWNRAMARDSSEVTVDYFTFILGVFWYYQNCYAHIGGDFEHGAGHLS